MKKIFSTKTVLITGGTGSLGKALVQSILSGKMGEPRKVIVFSRDEAKQHQMRLKYANIHHATDEIIYNNSKRMLEFRIGDVRDYHSVLSALQGVDIVINAAAMKQVPTCEYFPSEAFATNVQGAVNIVQAITENNLQVQKVLCVSTDKACKPVNVYGMTKSIQERVFINANLLNRKTSFVCVRYGNVLASRGSVIPLFKKQIENGGLITITSKEMTRFWLPMNEALRTIFTALAQAKPGETYIPKIRSSKIVDLAKVLAKKVNIKIKTIGVRPGEKVHEVLVSEEEVERTYNFRDYLVIQPVLPELRQKSPGAKVKREYSSKDSLMSLKELKSFLKEQQLMS